MQRTPFAEGRGAGEVVAQDVGDEVGYALIHHTWAGRRLPYFQQPPTAVLHAGDGHRLDAVAPVGESTVGGGQLQQAHFATAQRQCQAPALCVVEGRDAHCAG